MMGHYKAYWSIPHKLIVFALHRHGVLLKDTTMGFSVNHFLNQQLELGIDINGGILLTTFFL